MTVLYFHVRETERERFRWFHRYFQTHTPKKKQKKNETIKGSEWNSELLVVSTHWLVLRSLSLLGFPPDVGYDVGHRDEDQQQGQDAPYHDGNYDLLKGDVVF